MILGMLVRTPLNVLSIMPFLALDGSVGILTWLSTVINDLDLLGCGWQ